MEKWEYCDIIIDYQGGSFENYLNEKGEKGWELIKIFSLIETVEDKKLTIRGRFIFKRKIQQG